MPKSRIRTSKNGEKSRRWVWGLRETAVSSFLRSNWERMEWLLIERKKRNYEEEWFQEQKF
jgi:hypothetical protein